MDSDYLSRRGLTVTATDNCRAFVAIAQQFFPHLDVQEMDMTQPHLPAGIFDGIYAFASFIHLPRAAAGKTLRRLHSLLKPGGILFLSLIKSAQLTEYVIPDWGGLERNPVLFTCYPEAEIERRLLKAGFLKAEFHYVTSRLYAELPRLVDRGVEGYQVVAYRGGTNAIAE